MRIGIDIGGTHTDGALVDGTAVVRTCKLPTTDPLELGVQQVLRELDPEGKIEQIFVGTTHATNALLQAKGLLRVGVIRIAGQRPQLPAGYGWLAPLRDATIAGCETIGGGLNCDGGPITPFSLDEARAAIDRLCAAGAEAFAITGVFSPVSPEQEEEVAALLDLPYTLSHQLGGVGFLERENAAILNSALKRVIADGFAKLPSSVMMTQNNGTIISLERACEFPILTLSAGPTNSFVGGARLAGLDDAIIVDIGGTSTDVGVVLNGFARRSINQSQIGGVPLNFPMPDVQSVAIGGGSYIAPTGQIGPLSCARRLKEEALSFGGSRLTLTDVALALDLCTLPGAAAIDLDLDGEAIIDGMLARIEALIQKARAGRPDLPVVVVGGGSLLLPPGPHLIPAYASAANAIGATMAEISGTVDTVVSLETDRAQTLSALDQQTCQKAIQAGADPTTVRIVSREIIPYHYMPGGLARVITLAAGTPL